MLKRPGLLLAAALLLAVALVLGITRLFVLRFEHGDVYPPYSTLRSDPVGARVLYESIDELPDREVLRNFRPLIRLHPTEPVTLIYLGLDRQSRWGEDEFAEFQHLVANGARAVLAFAPESPRSSEPKPNIAKPKNIPPPKADDPAKSEKKDPSAKKDQEKSKEPDEEEKQPGLPFSEVAEKLGFKFGTVIAKPADAANQRAALGDSTTPAEPEISWHSATYFTDLKTGWRAVYTSDGRAVIAERALGSGSIVLASDSYLFSNEALRRERCPSLLAWLLGPARVIVFDEEHHGVVEASNVATLARKYRLHGLIAGALLAAALFVWKSAAPLIPPLASLRPDAEIVTGKSADEGLINLLRRSVAPSELLVRCAAEWKKSFDRDGRNPKAAHLEHVLAAEQSRAARERNPIAAYETITRGFAQKK